MGGRDRADRGGDGRAHPRVRKGDADDGARGEAPLAAAAAEDGVTVHKFVRYRELIKNGGATVPEVKAAVEAANADLHVLAFVTLFVPVDICDFPTHGTIVYHPSLLPLHRGASAINWTIISGDSHAGFTIFYADEGLDTGDIVLQRSFKIGENDTISSLYRDTLFPEGIVGISEAVRAIEDGTADRIVQTERDNMEPPYYDPLCQKPMLIDFSKPVHAPFASFCKIHPSTCARAHKLVNVQSSVCMLLSGSSGS